jgi:hypothetical protein
MDEQKTNIYILQLEKEKYYVGKSSDPINRTAQHFRGKGSAWTEKYPPISVIEIIENCDSFDEDKYTKIYMAKHGIANVRGGSYCQLKLSDDIMKLLGRELFGASDKCYNCGQNGHLIVQCPQMNKKVRTCSRCKRPGHTITSCKYKTNLNGDKLEAKTCKKCGRAGHTAGKCYAKTTTQGQEIPPKTCDRCGRTGHGSSKCYAKTTVTIIDEQSIPNSPPEHFEVCTRCQETGHLVINCPSKPVQINKQEYPCFRCRGLGHRASECCVPTDVDGKKITWNGCTNCGRKSHYAFRCGKKLDIYNRPVRAAMFSKIENFLKQDL